MSAVVLTLPGWQGSGPTHWQTRWESCHACSRVEQRDWMHPDLDEWIATLQAALVRQAKPVVLAAHSLGCALVAHWAARSPDTHRIRGALLVAPPDVERESAPQEVRGFAPLPMQRLPFPSLLVASTSDPYCGFLRAALLATCWGAEFINAGNAGHINADSDLADWPYGWELLARWL
ncbi:MAG TPA: alpha/beta hydrolase [Burkholderiaceae bacterium]|nr:alpha/beta hydrolase [Burkholderiaceae bacterium]